MTDERLPLIELLQKAGDGDFLRSVAEAVLQLLMEADVEGVIGAARHERTAERQTYRNGFRDRTLDTRLGTLQLRIPKLRAVLLAAIPGAPEDIGEGPGGCDPGSLDWRRLNAARGRTGPGHGSLRDQQEPGQQALQGHRRAGERLPGSPAQGRVALSLAGRHLPEAARGRADRFRGGNNRRGGRPRGRARGPRPAHRPLP